VPAAIWQRAILRLDGDVSMCGWVSPLQFHKYFNFDFKKYQKCLKQLIYVKCQSSTSNYSFKYRLKILYIIVILSVDLGKYTPCIPGKKN
jgi:hypothetical protein